MTLKPKSPKFKKKFLNVSITKQQSSDYELIASAYHEASHALVALANLISIDNVSITVNLGGDILYSCYQADNAEDEALKRIILMAELRTIYAGLVGERLYYSDICGNNKLPMFLKIGSSFDNKSASYIIRKYDLAKSGEDTIALKKNIKEDVEKFLLSHWGAIKIVAHSLYKKKKLGLPELKYLLIRSPEDKEFWKDKFKKIKIIYNEKSKLSERVVKNLISTKFKQ